MSWLAEANATSTASSATVHGSAAGSPCPIARIAATSAIWVASAQPRRRPSARVSHGSGSRSTTGAHRNLYE